jgi:hypothetical protein
LVIALLKVLAPTSISGQLLGQYCSLHQGNKVWVEVEVGAGVLLQNNGMPLRANPIPTNALLQAFHPRLLCILQHDSAGHAT